MRVEYCPVRTDEHQQVGYRRHGRQFAQIRQRQDQQARDQECQVVDANVVVNVFVVGFDEILQTRAHEHDVDGADAELIEQQEPVNEWSERMVKGIRQGEYCVDKS